jgi:hypothetical protein
LLHEAEMRIVGTLLSLSLIVLILVDAFETILQSRRVTHRFRFAALFYRNAWKLWRGTALLFPAGKHREAFLSGFGPLSLLGLFAVWMLGLIVGFALLHLSTGTLLITPGSFQEIAWGAYLYLSGTTFFTLGYGDVTPLNALGRTLAVIESGLGFGFLAVIVSYLPVLYQAFSRREVTISLLDARGGSPPSAGQILLRLARAKSMHTADSFLVEWEQWSAELLESHLSFPVLSYYRSQHDNQSWLAALTSILDTAAILMVEIKGADSYRAQLTFAMARHAAVDLSLVLRVSAYEPTDDRLPPERRQDLQRILRDAGVELCNDADVATKLAELRGMYEPFVTALARRFLFTLPPIMPTDGGADNWQRSAWQKRTPGIGHLPSAGVADEHFE